jgi:PelA/Pel-15E family pectate lyase
MQQGKVMIRLAIAVTVLLHSVSIKAQDLVADNMLVFQQKNGGWPKHLSGKTFDYNRQFSDDEKKFIKSQLADKDVTIDNKATTKEIRYLIKQFKKDNNAAYLKAAENGIKYLLEAQYKNGGFPQYYPDNSSYRHLITYNDDAMINALNILWDVAHKADGFEAVDASLVPKAEKAIERGIQCILRTQIKVKKQLTAWCAQHDENNFQPADARKFELASISGSESVGIVRFLMKVENPSPEIKKAITAAMEWFDKSKVVGYKMEDVPAPNLPKGKDRKLVADSASVIWARFYDIDSNTPFFSGRDSHKVWKMEEIEHERRIGYAWYGTWPKDLLEKEYPKWKVKNGL